MRWSEQAVHQALVGFLRIGSHWVAVAMIPVDVLARAPLLPQPLRWILGCQADRLDNALAGIARQSRVVRHVPFDFP
jgi:hypothetical protein